MILLISMLLLRVSVAQFQVNFEWGNCRRHFDAQVSKRGIRQSEVYNDNDVPCSWNVRCLYYFNGLTLLDQISGMDCT